MAEKALPPVVQKAVLEGKVVFFGEYRRGQAVEFSGKGNRLFHQAKCTVETEASGTITVTEFLPDGMDWKTWKEPFVKGTMVFGVCRGLEENSGVQVASGKLYAAA
jgi:hypothetical protein